MNHSDPSESGARALATRDAATPIWARRCALFAHAAAYTAIAAGGLTLLGWLRGSEVLKSLLPGAATMKPNTAVCFALLGLALELRARRVEGPHSGPRQWLAHACAGAAGLIGLTTGLQFVLGADFGLDEVLFPTTLAAIGEAHPGRMSGAAALSFVLVAAALSVLDLRPGSAARPAQYLAASAGLIGLLATAGYAYQVEALYSFPAYSSMALNTALALSVLSMGVLCARPESGWMRALTSSHDGGLMARRILPVSLALPLGLGWLCLAGVRAGRYEVAFAIAMFAVATLAVFTGVTLAAARSLNRVDAERRNAAETSRASAENLRVTLQSIGDGVMATDAGGRVTLMNPVAEVLTGWREEEALGRPLDEVLRLLHEDTRRPVESPAERVLREGRVVGLANHTLLVARDGSERPIADSGAPIRDAGQGVAGVVLVFRDQSEERRQVRALRQSEQRFRALVSASAQIVWTTDASGVAVEDSPSWRAFTGQTPEQWRGRGWVEALHPEDRERAMELWGAAVASRAGLGTEYRLRHVSGEWRWTSVRAVPLLDGEGGVHGWVGMNTDITERRRAEEALRESEARKSAILEAALDCIVTADREGRILEFNPAAQRVFGYEQAEVVGRELAETIVPPALRTQHRRGLAEYTVGGRGAALGRRLELTAMRADGSEFPVELAIHPIQLRDRTVFTAYLRDITQRKRNEAAVQASLTEKETLLGEIHHRVKNNMQVISSILSLQAGLIADDRARVAFDECQGRVRSMALVHERLYRSQDFATIDFAEHLREVAQMLVRLFVDDGGRVRLVVEASPITLDIDIAIPVGLILNELLTNALKYAFPDGRSGTVRVILRQEADELALSVDDDGVGLPPGFDWSESRTLGLRMVRSLLSQIDGKLEVHRQDGTRFTVRFRRASAGRARTSGGSAQLAAP